MPYNELDAAAKGAQSAVFKDYSVDEAITDAASAKEFKWRNDNAGQYLGYYKTISELSIAINTKATWTIGDGFEANELTALHLSTITGFGKDTFNSILENMIRDYHIYGDAYAEIVWDGEQMVNLKPLDPANMKNVSNPEGFITGFEQVQKDGTVKTFKPEDIFYLPRNRIADEIHGVSIIQSCEWIILARNEAMTDYKKLLHRNIYPVRLWHLDTDIESKILAFKAKVHEAKYEGEDIFIPKGAVEQELSTVPSNVSLNPLPWIQLLNQYFYQAVGVPQIVLGGSQELTQTAAQIAYLAFEQTISEEQLFIEEQVLAQLNLEIDLTFPASLRSGVLSDMAKDGTQQQQINQQSKLQPSFTRQPITPR